MHGEAGSSAASSAPEAVCVWKESLGEVSNVLGTGSDVAPLARSANPGTAPCSPCTTQLSEAEPLSAEAAAAAAEAASEGGESPTQVRHRQREDLRRLREAVEGLLQHRAEAAAATASGTGLHPAAHAADLAEAPEEFLDPILQTLMQASVPAGARRCTLPPRLTSCAGRQAQPRSASAACVCLLVRARLWPALLAHAGLRLLCDLPLLFVRFVLFPTLETIVCSHLHRACHDRVPPPPAPNPTLAAQDPVLLPDSRITVDRATIERHLLSSATDPFRRATARRGPAAGFAKTNRGPDMCGPRSPAWRCCRLHLSAPPKGPLLPRCPPPPTAAAHLSPSTSLLQTRSSGSRLRPGCGNWRREAVGAQRPAMAAATAASSAPAALVPTWLQGTAANRPGPRCPDPLRRCSARVHTTSFHLQTALHMPCTATLPCPRRPVQPGENGGVPHEPHAQLPRARHSGSRKRCVRRCCRVGHSRCTHPHSSGCSWACLSTYIAGGARLFALSIE